MSNAFLNAAEYANAMLLLAKNRLVTGKLVSGQFKDQVTDENGLTISVKRPPRFARNDASANSAALAAQDIITGSVNVAVNQYAKVHMSVGDVEYITSFNALMRNEAMKSAASTLAHQIDAFLQSKVLGFHSWVAGNTTTGGINAVTPATLKSPGQCMSAYTRLLDMGVPGDSISATITPLDGELVRGSLIGTNIDGINKNALQQSKIPLISEIDWYQTQQVASITTGSRTATADDCQINNGTLSKNYRDVKNSGNYTQTISIDGGTTATGTVKAGEVITIGSVFAYDWRNQKTLPYLMQFTVVSDATMSGGAVDLTITPPLIVPGTSDGVDTNGNTAFATVNAAAVDGANVNFVGAASTAYNVPAVWRKNAIQMVSARLRTPDTGVASFAQDPETGIAIRYWRASDVTTGAHIMRFDCVYGATLVDGFLGTRLTGT